MAAKGPTYIVVASVCTVGAVAAILVLVGILLYCQRKKKISENALRMTMAMALNTEDNEPLRPR